MADEKVAPTLAELEAKVSRLASQVDADVKAAATANDAFTRAVKSGDVDKALELADTRTAAKSTVAKSESQLKSAKSAVASAKHAANADKIAALHDQIRTNKELELEFVELEKYGIKRVVLERSEETGKIIVNSVGPQAPKRQRASNGGGGGRGEPLTVDGQAFDSASAALMHFRPDFDGKMGRSAIVSWLANNGHEVS